MLFLFQKCLFVLFTCLVLNVGATAQGSKELPIPKDINKQLLWGTYKPQLISAITQKSIYPISVGLGFSDFMKEVGSEEDFKKILRFRMRRDTRAQYSYHNGLDFAVQHIIDPELGIALDTTFLEEFDFLNTPAEESRWTYLIESSSLPEEEKEEEEQQQQRIPWFNSFVYVGLGDYEGKGNDQTWIRVLESDEPNASVIEIVNKTKNQTEGFIKISFLDESADSFDTNIRGVFDCAVNHEKKSTWKVEDIIYSHLTEDFLDEMAYIDPRKCQNFFADEFSFFLKHIVNRPGTKILITFSSKQIPKKITLDEIQKKIDEKKRVFEDEFEKKFPIQNVNKFKFNTTEALEISRYSLSNLLGGIQYSYGQIRVLQSGENKAPPFKELFTGTPSRVGFPRGFLWDEGFHQSFICEWNTTLCISMMRTWFDSIQENGWIPREQARGDELESNFMQKEFLYQSQEEANPPSMVLAISKLINKLYGSGQKKDHEDLFEIFKFLQETYPKLQLWFFWLINSQQNKNPSDGCDSLLCLRWMCKHPCDGKYFASGLDDYPRHPRGYHAIAQLDLHIWMENFARILKKIEKMFKVENEKMEQFHSILIGSIEGFYDQNDHLPKDIIGLENRIEKKTKKYRLTNLGYVNLWPIAFGIEEETSPRFEAIINLMTARKHLWSDFGLRSLSKSDPFFQKADNYWTEPIWIPVNYLVLRGLKNYYLREEKTIELYQALRENLIENISATWKKTHNFWEQYDSFTGKGKGFPSFTGWTSLISLIYSEKYD